MLLIKCSLLILYMARKESHVKGVSSRKYKGGRFFLVYIMSVSSRK